MKRSWVEVSRSRLQENVAAIRNHLSPSTRIIAVVKANAYGHGVKEVSRCLVDLGIGDFTVATVECLADNFPNTQLTYTTDPGPGEAFWFLARAVTAGGNGTYDSTGTMQVGARDAEVNASRNACP